MLQKLDLAFIDPVHYFYIKKEDEIHFFICGLERGRWGGALMRDNYKCPGRKNEYLIL